MMTEWQIRRDGRAWGAEAISRFELTPEKTEMFAGRLYATTKERLTMLALLLENVGADEVVRLGDPDVWRAAVAALDHNRTRRDDDALAAALASDERDRFEQQLLAGLRSHREGLEALLRASSDHWGYEDPVYRFYHQSYKVFALQGATERIVGALRTLVPGRPLHPWFLELVRRGTGRQFALSDNDSWTQVTRPIVEAFFHARYFLEMAVRYAALETPPRPLPSGYAALLYLFGLR
jgi:hypothetical protein